jgi:hypothetical protein
MHLCSKCKTRKRAWDLSRKISRLTGGNNKILKNNLKNFEKIENPPMA